MDKLLKVTVITWAAFLILLAGMLLTTQAAEPETFAGAGQGGQAGTKRGSRRRPR